MYRHFPNSLITLSLLGVLTLGTAQADLGRIAPPEGASVYFISPADGETVAAPFTVRMGLKGAGVAPAGVDRPDTGHHHLLVNKDLSAVNLDSPLPFTDHTLHFGGGQTEAEVSLPPGRHTLQLLFMDYRHASFDPPLVSEQITVIVE
ncbi:DUF4399 domain-containing protein [Ectothiorhodospira lacustris]|uniref:DUF4399 domain-containing protein n=1 Tax=Ectothiorhodospira lacustris TaxID=2899127 RepID=UPI001EE8724E|nr:DUF4399 domain-containing protein [Ectothiorhodospira lacustris]MCG5499889.1 DUF4399 domain-containing protein [Ectothiorhodospira lacustris]MCG5509033.1 DUF4399 domain-containing protein [Ectothiorhodospira lacustris]MCG5520824.1 DUF4399 domain-containing protein [Ectothiorhodospira lacustris]